VAHCDREAGFERSTLRRVRRARARATLGGKLLAGLLLGAFASCGGSAPESARQSHPSGASTASPAAGEAGAAAIGVSETGGADSANTEDATAGVGGSQASRATSTRTSSSQGAGGGDAVTAEASDDAGQGGAPFALPSECDSDTLVPPTHLVCTGLYADIATKAVAPGLETYAPAVPLWSDGAEKQRWISLPPGTTIDNSDPSEWTFPLGTKVWKQFSRGGSRVETRLWQKVDTGYWVAATYAWDEGETTAVRSAGGDITLPDGSSYHIPTPDECQDCHRGRTDRILGFEQALLGLAGATGYNLERLSAEGRLSNPPAATTLTIGDDGTDLAAPALAWLHVNCGVTCHNRNSNAMAWSTGLFMRLDATELDGRAVNDFDTLSTSIGVAAVTPAWQGRIRISAGEPAQSLLFDLITHRGTGQQMPPIASNVVDEADVPLVEAWITELPHSSGSGGVGGVGGVGGATGRGGANGGRGTMGGAAAGGHGANETGGAGGAPSGDQGAGAPAIVGGAPSDGQSAGGTTSAGGTVEAEGGAGSGGTSGGSAGNPSSGGQTNQGTNGGTDSVGEAGSEVGGASDDDGAEQEPGIAM
jgi:hypothetical protein